MTLAQNEREIAPVTLWVNGTSYTARVFALNGYAGYNFVDNPGQVQWTLMSYEETTDPNTGDVTVTKNQIMQGITPLTYPLVENWGTDDQPIFVYVAAQLNLTLV